MQASLINTHFFRRNNGYVVLVDVSSLFLDPLRIAFAFKLFACQPECDILVAVLADEELLEELATNRIAHETIERRTPRANLVDADVVDVALEAVSSCGCRQICRQVVAVLAGHQTAWWSHASTSASASGSHRRQTVQQQTKKKKKQIFVIRLTRARMRLMHFLSPLHFTSSLSLFLTHSHSRFSLMGREHS